MNKLHKLPYHSSTFITLPSLSQSALWELEKMETSVNPTLPHLSLTHHGSYWQRKIFHLTDSKEWTNITSNRGIQSTQPTGLAYFRHTHASHNFRCLEIIIRTTRTTNDAPATQCWNDYKIDAPKISYVAIAGSYANLISFGQLNQQLHSGRRFWRQRGGRKRGDLFCQKIVIWGHDWP